MDPIFRDMIEAASAAYSPQNAQAWRFLPIGDRLLARPDLPRLFPHADPRNRGGWVSLGAAVENARLCAMLAGYGTAVGFDPGEAWPAAVQLVAGPAWDATDVHLAAQIPLRRTHRGPMAGPPPATQDLTSASVAALPGARMLRVPARDRVAVLDLLEFAVRTQLSDHEVRRDLHRYQHLWPWQAAGADDGLLAENLGMGRVRAAALRVAMLPPLISTLAVPARLARQARRIGDSSPDFLLFVSGSDDATGWFEGGRGWQRAALALCARGIATHAVGAPLDVPDAAAALRGLLEVPSGEGLVALVRAGRATRSPPPTRRRPVGDLLDEVPGELEVGGGRG